MITLTLVMVLAVLPEPSAPAIQTSRRPLESMKVPGVNDSFRPYGGLTKTSPTLCAGFGGKGPARRF